MTGNFQTQNCRPRKLREHRAAVHTSPWDSCRGLQRPGRWNARVSARLSCVHSTPHGHVGGCPEFLSPDSTAVSLAMGACCWWHGPLEDSRCHAWDACWPQEQLHGLEVGSAGSHSRLHRRTSLCQCGGSASTPRKTKKVAAVWGSLQPEPQYKASPTSGLEDPAAIHNPTPHVALSHPTAHVVGPTRESSLLLLPWGHLRPSAHVPSSS